MPPTLAPAPATTTMTALDSSASSNSGDSSASTTLKKALAKGATKLDVASDAGFKIGDLIDVGPGTPEHEVNTVKAFGSIICATPLQNDHPAGTVVAKAAKAAAPAPVPAPAT